MNVFYLIQFSDIISFNYACKRGLSASILMCVIYILFNLSTPYIDYCKNRSVENQITYLDQILSEGYDDELQSRYPEGKIFSNALLALSIIDYSANAKITQKKHAIIADRCIDRLLSESTSATFSIDMVPKFGAFYNGWINFTLSNYIKSDLFDLSERRSQILASFQVLSNEIVCAQSDSIRILDSYPGASWPADNLVGMASLDHKILKNQWIDKLYATSNTESKLLNHSGYNTAEVRGSSQALLLFLLCHHDKQKASTENKIFRDLLVDRHIGIDLVREFPKDVDGYPDVDSGPVICGYGAVATVMNVKLQAKLNNVNSKYTWAFLNAISFPINVFGEKYYLCKREPMFDIFMLWCLVEL